MPDKVFVVIEFDYDDVTAVAVFADEDDAEKFVGGRKDYAIVEVPYNT